MDELMVEDAGVVPDVQTEITLGEGAANVNPEEEKVATGKDVLLPLSEVVPTSRPTGRRGRGSTRTSEASSSDANTEDWSGRTRSSGRSSRKKFDPDFCYDNALAFAGGRKRSAKSPASSMSPASSANGKRIPLDSDNGIDVSKTGSITDSMSTVSQADSATTTASSVQSDDPYSIDNLALEREEDEKPSLPLKEPTPPVELPAEPSDETPEKMEERPKREASSRRVSAVEDDSDSSDDANSSVNQTKLYCICKKPYGNRFMISCDKCDEWYHGTCVGVSKAQGKNYARKNLPWFCPPCRKKNTALSNAVPVVKVEATKPVVSAPSEEITSSDKEKGVPPSDSSSGNDVTSAETSSVETGREKTGAKETPPKVKEKKEGKVKIVKDSTQSKLKPMKGDLKEFIQRQKSNEARHVKKKVEEKIKEEKPLPVEADSSGLRLTALGKPRLEYKQKRPSLPVVPPPKNNRPQLFSADIKTSEPRTPTTPTMKASPASSQSSHKSSEPTRPKIRRHHCMVCKSASARENSLYCSSKCIHQHAILAMRLAKSIPDIPDDRVAVKEKHGGRELNGENAPLRSNIIGFLEGHQTFYVPVPDEVLQAEEKGSTAGPQDDPVRATTKMMLKDHLTNRWREAPDLQDISPAMISKIVDELEAGLFHNFKDTGNAYKRKYRTIVMNINDKKNENFFRRILRKEVHPDKVVDLTPEQMASDSMAQWRQNEIKKELDMLIQTQTEDIDSKPNIKKTHRGEEPIEEEFLSQDREILEDNKPDENAEKISPVELKSNFSPAVLSSPTGSTFPSHISPRESSESPHTDIIKSPEGGASRPDTTGEHEDHIFDANCRICTSSLPGFSRDLEKYSSTLQSKVKEEEKNAEQPPRVFYGPRTPVAHSSSSTASFRVPDDSVPAKKSRFSRSTETSPNASSPQSSTSEFSPDADEEAKASARGVIWQGEVDTCDLPIVKLEGFAVYGRASEAMHEIPKKVRQLGRIQPGQLWPYIEQVKPLKEMALVTFKPPPGRVSSEFNSYHYFLTTRGRVAVIGPLPATFKDFYIIALKEDEPLPDGLRFPEGIAFDGKHPKIFLGIIVFHSPLRTGPPIGRGIFDVPALPSVGMTRVANYVSPKTPDSAENSPNINQTKADPIVGKFLTIPRQPSPDTSEPMDIEDDAPTSKASEVKPLVVTNAPPPVTSAPLTTKVTPADLLKVMDSLPSFHQGALKEVVKSVSAKQPSGTKASKPAVPVDPRLARLNAAAKVAVDGQPVTPLAPASAVESAAAPVYAPITVPPPSMTYAPITVPPPNLSVPPPVVSQAAPPPEKDDDGFGFSQKFIENLSRIQLPPGLKEALKSISGPGEGTTAPPPVSAPPVSVAPAPLPPIPPGGSLLGPGPSGPLLGVAPPMNLAPTGYNMRPPSLSHPPPGFNPGQPPPGFPGPRGSFPPFPPPLGPPPHQPSNFPGEFNRRAPPGGPFRQQQGPPEEHGDFRARGPPDQRRNERVDRRDRDENGRWPGPPRSGDKREDRPERWNSDSRRPNRVRERSNERKERGIRSGRRSRSRSRSPLARRRSYRSKSKSRSRSRERERDREKRARSRSRSRSPRRARESRKKEEETGVDEFGRDITLRKKLKRDPSEEQKDEKGLDDDHLQTDKETGGVDSGGISSARVEVIQGDGSEPVTP
ncbi:death-inducer obliterator 1-like [Paramacrobiotus metropolitanus]|uniref:death-inducer obliterator 1-like n=1 Tax=Paramacrobiotus metropolitanus TaxID=2943436 RepID=UPI002446191D|nr:death-inducer obliterator 1-like [Paramacrobiotus metropolitanus]XP_055327868.1 death-inducer obliterator 1-like [Paramacrobiotus metropolitanus]